MGNAILEALAKQMPYFRLPRTTPEYVELRVCYDTTTATLRISGEDLNNIKKG